MSFLSTLSSGERLRDGEDDVLRLRRETVVVMLPDDTAPVEHDQPIDFKTLSGPQIRRRPISAYVGHILNGLQIKREC
jgi:hypothetical protein